MSDDRAERVGQVVVGRPPGGHGVEGAPGLPVESLAHAGHRGGGETEGAVVEERVAETVAKEFGNEPCTEPAQGYGHVLSEGDAPADRPPLPMGRVPVLADSVRRS